MHKLNKKNWFSIILVLFVGILLFFFINQGPVSVKEVKKSFTENDVSTAVQITCTYPQVLNANYLNGEISHNIPQPEKNSIIFTFSKLEDPKVGQLSYIDSTQSITNVPIFKITDDSEKFIYLDGTGENYLSTHTVYKKAGVSTYTKTVSIFGIPSGTLAVGTCVGY